MAEYRIEFTEDGKHDLSFYTAHARKIIASEIRAQFMHQPLVETRNRKPLRDNPLAPWELRVGKFRIFYQVVESTVSIIAVGHKEYNVLFIKGKEVKL